MASPFQECKPFAVRRHAHGGGAKSCPVRNAAGLLDGFATAWVNAYLPVVAGMLIGVRFSQCVNQPAIGQPQKVIQPFRLRWWKDRDRRPALQIAADEVGAGLIDLFVEGPLSIWRPKEAPNRTVFAGVIKFACLLSIGSHQPDFTVTQSTLVCFKRNGGTIPRNGIRVGLTAKLMGRPTQHRDNPNAGALGSPITGVTPWRMGIGEKLPAVREPGANLPVDPFALELVRLGDSLRLAAFDELDVHPLPVGVRQLSSIGRNCTCPHAVLAGVTGELPQLQFRGRILGNGLAFGEPQSRTRDQEYSNSSRCQRAPAGDASPRL